MVIKPELLQNFVRRATPKAGLHVPLGARSVAHVRFPPKHIEDNQQKPFLKMMWCIAGCAEVRCGSRLARLQPAQLAVFPADTLHYAQAGDEPWEVCWWTLDGTQTLSIATAFGFGRAGVYEAGPAPLELIERLAEALRDITPAGEIGASAVAYQLLACAAQRARRPEEDELVVQAMELLQRHWSEATFSVKSLAAELGVHRSSLTRRFFQHTGICPSRYLQNLRLQQAMMLLKRTAEPVQQVGLRCGFEDASYFARLFHKVQGVSPRTFRQSQGA